MSEEYQIALCTCPDEETAEMVANHLVDEQLATCVNILPGMRSVYRWQGEVESNNEVMLVIKTMGHVFEQLEEVILRHHPYELPEIVTVPISNGEKHYLSWISSGISPKQ